MLLVSKNYKKVTLTFLIVDDLWSWLNKFYVYKEKRKVKEKKGEDLKFNRTLIEDTLIVNGKDFWNNNEENIYNV